MSIKVSHKYKRKLEKYLNWCCGTFLRPNSELKDINGVTPEEYMFCWESLGKRLTCNDPEKLVLYIQGKQCRDWHISEWRQGIKEGLFLPEEFLGCLGMDEEEYKSVFKDFLNDAH